ncbi:hypothetical protein QR77_20555 [Streptomyces sp. 150FB]|uniref:DUF397 domain-containing protein n=1 Tax=Streptomyces sp. 150FB TaxID=1576605 RepID=UPI000588F419|nr:DUF397 domain-containing protein [Streptomyces sp. 150FB]KIF75645.1 hypothetical protein QR77_20555 [Streptomyces sp. 150FB]
MTTTPHRTHSHWVKSSYSGNGGGSCVEWAPSNIPTTGTVPVRDSKNPTHPGLTLAATAWTAFVTYAATHNVTSS